MEASRDASEGRIFLLGAGASVEGGIPSADRMPMEVHARLREDPISLKAIEIAIAGIRYQKAIDGQPFRSIDIEELYDALEALADRSRNVLAPFVANWSPSLSLLREHAAEQRLAELDSRQGWESMRKGARNVFLSGPGLFEPPTHEQVAQAVRIVLSEGRHEFKSAAEALWSCVEELCTLLSFDRIEYYAGLIKSASTQGSAIVSLNYDNAVELVASKLQIPIDVGIASDGRVCFRAERCLRLIKLHGSVDWADEYFSVRRGRRADQRAAMILGTGKKLRADGPYLDLLMHFKKELAACKTLVTCGYSFRDAHINHLVVDWLNGIDTARLQVVDPFLGSKEVAANIEGSLRLQQVEPFINSRADFVVEKASQFFSKLS